MKLTIKRMEINNFKGFKHMVIDFGEKRTAIFARNGLGKSSIYDAFTWVLFNRDASGNAPGTDSFREKPMSADGQELHNLDTSVSLECLLDGQPFNMLRVQRENWVKKRGREESVFSGNVSTYAINGVELKVSDFKARIAAICPEDIFPFVATMSAFNDADWKTRRKILMDMSGLDVETQLLASPEYSPLHAECITRNVSTDDLKKALQTSLRAANQEMEMLPVRLDEAKRSMPELKDFEVADAKEIIERGPVKLAAIDKKIAALKVDADAAGKADRILSLQTELTSLRNTIKQKHEWNRSKLTDAVPSATRDRDQCASVMARVRSILEDEKAQAAHLEAEREALRHLYAEAYKTVYEDSVSDTCPTCGQKLPADAIERARAAAKAAFMADKQKELAKIKAQGTDVAKRLGSIQAKLDEDAVTAADAQKRYTDACTALNAATAALAELPAFVDYASDPRCAELEKEIAELEGAESKHLGPNTATLALYEDRAGVEKEVSDARGVLMKKDLARELEARISNLEMRQRTLGDQIAGLEKQIMLCERFVTDRCNLLEESINAPFKTLSWKLFNTQINGGITDVCSCMIPCPDGLVAYAGANKGAKLLADVEIISVLSRHFDVQLPLFFDNKESVNDTPSYDGQLITLSVTEDDPMRIVTE